VRRLFLGSDGLAALPEFVAGAPTGRRVLFIPTGADPVVDKSFMARDLAFLADLELEVEQLDLKRATELELAAGVARADILYVEGGSSVYLLAKARESGFAALLPQVIDESKPYVGMSGGAVILAPDIAPFVYGELPPPLTSTSGLGIVDFLVLPHAGSRAQRYKRTAADYGERLELIPLRDDEALIVEGNARRIVAS
jgi:dipeptidase E